MVIPSLWAYLASLRYLKTEMQAYAIFCLFLPADQAPGEHSKFDDKQKQGGESPGQGGDVMHPVMHPEKNEKTGKMGGNGGKWGKMGGNGGKWGEQGETRGPETRRNACSNTMLLLQPSIYKLVQTKPLQTAIVMQHHCCTVSLTLHPALPLIPDPLQGREATLHVG